MTVSTQIINGYGDVDKIRDNYVHLNESSGSEFLSSSVQFTGTGNVLFIEDGAKLRNSKLRFMGNDAVIYIRKSPRFARVIASVFHESVFYLGPGSSFTSEARFLPTERKHVIIGSDAMFSSRVAFRTADPHLIYSAGDHQRVNQSKSVWVGDHVWLGEDALFLKGARIGSGSIIAARSVVTKTVPSNSTAAGVPARIVGRNIFWTRPSVHAYTQEQTDRSSAHQSSEFVYESDETTLDHDVMEAQLDGLTSGLERAAWCEKLDKTETSNRFFVA